MPEQKIKIEIDVPATMRDGTILRADVYRPDTPEQCPVLITRSPYNKSRPDMYTYFDPIRATKNGYAVVVQDCRGSMASEGEFHPFLGDVEDGYDTVEWAAAQPWCNSKVGMYGMSYLAITQWCAAIAQPPHLVAIFPASLQEQGIVYRIASDTDYSIKPS